MKCASTTSEDKQNHYKQTKNQTKTEKPPIFFNLSKGRVNF